MILFFLFLNLFISLTVKESKIYQCNRPAMIIMQDDNGHTLGWDTASVNQILEIKYNNILYSSKYKRLFSPSRILITPYDKNLEQ
jgi:hypothetical protein